VRARYIFFALLLALYLLLATRVIHADPGWPPDWREQGWVVYPICTGPDADGRIVCTDWIVKQVRLPLVVR
jgi:hypothetical protein